MRTSGLRRRNRENQERVAVSALAEVGAVDGRGERGPVEKGLRGPVVAADGGDTILKVSEYHVVVSRNCNLHLSESFFLPNHLLKPLLSRRIGNSLLEEDLGADTWALLRSR